MIKLSEIKANPSNPRLIRDEKFKKLVQSIKDFPKMMALRPIVVDKEGIVQGGNMRLKALIEAGYKEVPKEWIARAENFSEDELREFIVKDNVSFGEWNWGDLANEWNEEELAEWGIDVPSFNIDSTDYSEKNKEIDLDDFEEKMEFKLKLTSDQFFDLQERLSVVKAKQNVNTNEDAIFELLNTYEARL